MITTDKRYQVFVSSTYEDLQDERKEVMQALLELDCIPAGMELFPASSEDQWTLIQRVIDDCDYYILIIGGRYGSIGSNGISYTQMEFEYALNTGKPIISFIHKNPASIPSGKSEQTEEGKKKLEEFKKLAEKKLVKFWETPDELGSVVSRSMIKLMKNFPAEGWVKAGSAVDEKSIKEIARLQKENEELRKKIEKISVEAPEGTENLKQGEDFATLEFEYSVKEVWGGGYKEIIKPLNITWNELFSGISPLLINEASETEIKEALEKIAQKRIPENFEPDELSTYSDVIVDGIAAESFGTICVQFKALGYIQLSEKKHTARSSTTYWSLTKYGEYVMTRLVAQKRCPT